MSNVFITGVAGFIGYSLAKRLIQDGHNVVGLDNMNDYYDPMLKRQRVNNLIVESAAHKNFDFIEKDLGDLTEICSILNFQKFDYIYHLAAQAGVRYSFENPKTYFESNVTGTFNLIELLRSYPIKRFILASTSSIYGNSHKLVVSETDALKPIQFYAVSKKLDEILCETYSKIYNLKVTVFRFFTVYGPWGRPDMALFKFVNSIIENQPVEVYNFGNHKRSFTYIDDVVHYLVKAMDLKYLEDPFQVYNLGNPKSVNLLDLVAIIEEKLGNKAEKKYLPLQFGDVYGNLPNIDKLVDQFGDKSFTDIDAGVDNFINWYKEYYKIL
jgi:UDP-glucuronate 4-epimerase